MKLITAIIKPFKLEEVRESLDQLGITGMTISEVKGYGRQKGHTELYRGAEYVIDFLPKIKIEVAVRDDQTESIVEAISSCFLRKNWRWKDFYFTLEKVIRIRTGELNEEAL